MREWLEWLRAHAGDIPLLVKFAVGLGVIIIVPQICRRLHVPAVVGLLLSGALFGPYGSESSARRGRSPTSSASSGSCC